MKYVVITPARNEAENIASTIRSMSEQSLLPDRWVIVNDGSNDATGGIIDEASRDYPWITVVHRADRGFRKQGGGVIEAFYAGFDTVLEDEWDFLVKFDADTSFERDYFERCLEEFSKDAKLGVGGGMICQLKNGQLESESPGDPMFHVRGATKIYRRECWDAIGGLLRCPGWDTIDEFHANMLGWSSRTFVNITIRHHREAGGVDGAWKNWVKNGLANYLSGYHPLFMAAKCTRRVVMKPRLVAATGLWTGYCSGIWRKNERTISDELKRYVRSQQLRRLTGRPSVYDGQLKCR